MTLPPTANRSHADEISSFGFVSGLAARFGWRSLDPCTPSSELASPEKRYKADPASSATNVTASASVTDSETSDSSCLLPRLPPSLLPRSGNQRPGFSRRCWRGFATLLPHSPCWIRHLYSLCGQAFTWRSAISVCAQTPTDDLDRRLIYSCSTHVGQMMRREAEETVRRLVRATQLLKLRFSLSASNEAEQHRPDGRSTPDPRTTT